MTRIRGQKKLGTCYWMSFGGRAAIEALKASGPLLGS
jgi:hypothetical protein